jgi:hypothetical protein
MSAQIIESSLEIKLIRADRVYRPNDSVEGVVIVTCKSGWAHKGIQLQTEGLIHLSLASRGISLGSDVVTAGKPLQLFSENLEVVPAGKFAEGIHEIPFEFVLKGKDGQQLMESYHGVYISVIYNIRTQCERGVMSRTLSKEIEFIAEVQTTKQNEAVPSTFEITPKSLENVPAEILKTIPNFKLSGRIHRSFCPINQPFTGEAIVQLSDAPVRSVELQLVRVETVVVDGASHREATEIQFIQIGEGNICRDMIVPMYMVFPRLFSCPTVVSTQFKIEFEVNLIVVFGEGYMVTENFPVVITRENS